MSFPTLSCNSLPCTGREGSANTRQLFLEQMARQLFKKVGRQMLMKLGRQTLTKIDRQLFHTIATDGRLAGANQQMFLTYTIDYVTPDRFFCLAWWLPSYHYSYA